MPASPPLVTVVGPDCLPTLVPHLVGFHPQRSLVLLGLAGSSVRVTVRLDLPGRADPGAPDALPPPWRSALRGLARVEADSAVVVVYPDAHDDPWAGTTPGPLPHRHLAADARRDLEERGIEVRDVVCIVGSRIRSYLCADPQCCPPEGHVAPAAESLRVQAAFVEQGSAPLASRDVLSAQLAERSQDDPLRAAVRHEETRAAGSWPRGVRAAVTAFVEGLEHWADDPSASEALAGLVADVGPLVGHVPARDLLLHRITLHPERALLCAARAVLAEAVRCAEPHQQPAPAAVLAVCCWLDGDGAAAGVALERALDADPTCSLAVLVADALDQAMPPWAWTALMTALREQDIVGPDEPLL